MEQRTPPSASPANPETNAQRGIATARGQDQDVLRLFAEDVAVDRETVETGRVRVTTVTRTRDHLIDEPLLRTSVEVKRVPIGRVIDSIPPVKEDAGVTIIPVVEETVIVERRLVLKEEVHVRRLQTTERYQETVQLRHQTAEVTRIPAVQAASVHEAAAGSTTERKPEDT
jgi:uncharacterized protein (TIGR02271 family)